MSKRNYNVFFNTHTVSGIIISVALYIIFFCGAFSLFKNEILLWENADPINKENIESVNYDRFIDSLKQKEYYLYGRDISLTYPKAGQELGVLLYASKDTLAPESAKTSDFFYLNLNSYKTKTYYEKYNLGEFLYRLHFFHQIPRYGIYLAGLVAFFFLFAIITGVIVHWKKIISNFYVFRPKTKLKTIWTDAHTVLGMIGLPFQFIFAVTSCFLCLSILVLIPANFLYDNDQTKLLEDIRPYTKTYPLTEQSKDSIVMGDLVKQATAHWEDFQPSIIFIKNFGDRDMKIQVDGLLNPKKRFFGHGRVLYDYGSKEFSIIKDPYKNNYIEGVELGVRRLHYGDFGGLMLKMIYAVLAFITCFVIITGVLIWLEARNKRNIPPRQQLFNRKVGHIYVAICMTIFPVTAAAFILSKFIGHIPEKLSTYYWFFFGLWFLMSVYYRFKRNNYTTTKQTLFLGGILGLLIPIINGIISGNWVWHTLATDQIEIFIVDLFWILMGLTALFIVWKMKPVITPKTSTHQELKTQYKQEIENLKQEQLEQNNTNDINYIPMRTKIVILWLFSAIGWLIHHIYGLFNIYYNETLILDDANGEAPLVHHIYRILFEGICMLFVLLTLQVSKQWFKWLSFVWAIIAGAYNIYHFITAIIYESSNISEIFMLLLMVIASIILMKTIYDWTKKVV